MSTSATAVAAVRTYLQQLMPVVGMLWEYDLPCRLHTRALGETQRTCDVAAFALLHVFVPP